MTQTTIFDPPAQRHSPTSIAAAESVAETAAKKAPKETSIGERFGRLVVVGSPISKGKYVFVPCKCDCGLTSLVLRFCLFNGKTRSCGCGVRDSSRKRAAVLNLIHGMCNSREFKSWSSMKERCINPNNKNFRNYGGRGIGVCGRWLDSFENFMDDMGPRPADSSLDRIDVNGNYEPSNCRWATKLQQARNTRSTVYLEIDGMKKSIPEWAEDSKCAHKSQRLLRERVFVLGWDAKRALTRPKRNMEE